MTPFIVTFIIVVFSINVAAGGQLKDACSSQADCDAGLECSKNKCLIPYRSPMECVTGWDCVTGVSCHYEAGQPGRCLVDHRCPANGVCTKLGTECDEDGVCGYKENEVCYGPCKTGLVCVKTRCQRP
uniref:Ubs_16 putative toxin n=1 Tax=Unedogemmula bisaya TaxID=746885 RepID=A0A098LXZ9_UNEBI